MIFLLKQFFSIVLILAMSSSVFAAYHYIKPSGSGDGSSWTNAMAFPSTFVRGDTYYVAEGSYTGTKYFNTATSGTSSINFKKCGTSDGVCTAAAGYTASEHDGQAVFGIVYVQTKYWLFDGVTGGGPGAWTTGLGMKFQRVISQQANPPTFLSGNFTFRHCEFDGDNTAGSEQRALYTRQAENQLYSYCWFHGYTSDTIKWDDANGSTIEYSKISDNNPSAPGVEHPDIIEVQGWYTTTNLTVRYSFITDFYLTYIFGAHGDIDGYNIYGNIIHYISGDATGNGINGTLSSSGSISNIKFYNNTITGVWDSGYQYGVNVYSMRGSNNLFYNNIWNRDSGSSYGFGWSDVTHDDNAFWNYTSTEDNYSGNPLVNSGAGDYSLTSSAASTMAAGRTLTGYSTDMFGNTRGADGKWDRGAIEYISSGGDYTSPVVTISTSDPQTITSDSLSVAWTCSDAVGVTSQKWRIGAPPSASAGTTATSPATTTGYSEGSNTLYVGCGDAAGNWGSDSITVTYDSVPAFIDNLSPSGVLPCTSNPRNVELNHTTNEAATSRMTTVSSAVAYADMTDTFTTTGSTSHSETKSLACGESYNYWVRTSDASGNVNTSSEVISFSIASPQIAGPGGLRLVGGKIGH